MPLRSYATQRYAIAVRCFSIPMHCYSEYCHYLSIQSFALPWRHFRADPNCSFSFLCTPARCFASANLYRTAPKLFFALPLPGGSMRYLAFALPLLFQAVQFISLSLQRAASPMPGKSLLFLCHSARNLASAKLCFSCAILCQTMPVASLNMSCLFQRQSSPCSASASHNFSRACPRFSPPYLSLSSLCIF